MTNKKIEMPVWEYLKLKEIKQRHKLHKLANADCSLSIFIKIGKLNPNTPVSEIEEMQEQLRAMINQAEKDMLVIKEDRKFVKEMMEKYDIENDKELQKM